LRPVLLIGFMGAGKSTVGRLLASRLGAEFVDLDDEIRAREGASIAQLFSVRGESGFRAAERRALEDVAARDDVVVACGGGVVVDEASRAVLAGAGTIVYLRVSSGVALARVGKDTVGRPLLQGCAPGAAAALLRSRERIYEAVAEVTLETEERTPAEIADELAKELDRRG
jgi:shikimate kinase